LGTIRWSLSVLLIQRELIIVSSLFVLLKTLYDWYVLSVIFLYLNFVHMWRNKNCSLDLSEYMTEEEMVEFWFEQSKQEQDSYYTDSLSLSYKLLD